MENKTTLDKEISLEPVDPVELASELPTTVLPDEPKSSDKIENWGEVKSRSDRIDQETNDSHEADSIVAENDGTPEKHTFTQKIGIVGGKGVGKSYFFQSIVYRTMSGVKSGALSYYLKGNAKLQSAPMQGGSLKDENLTEFIDHYQKWQRLAQTTIATQRWYRLHLPYRTGWLGMRRNTLEIDFLDSSGEGFCQAMLTDENQQIWREHYLQAQVMVFCLPLWVAFPEQDRLEKRDDILKGFKQVVHNFTQMRKKTGENRPVRSILALTMADDLRCALKTLRNRWILPQMTQRDSYAMQLQKSSMIALYLRNARTVSDLLHQEFEHVSDPCIASIPEDLNFGQGKPWLIPVSAIEGHILDNSSTNKPPVPIHVELPLLVTLCEFNNALM